MLRILFPFVFIGACYGGVDTIIGDSKEAEALGQQLGDSIIAKGGKELLKKGLRPITYGAAEGRADPDGGAWKDKEEEKQ